MTTWPPKPPKKEAAREVKMIAEPNPFQDGLKQALTYRGDLGTVTSLDMGSPNGAFTSMSTICSLGCIVGCHTVWRVMHARHSPLISVTDTMYGINDVGGQLLMGGDYVPTNIIEELEASAALISSIYIFGGYIVMNGMLDMLKCPISPRVLIPR